MAEFPVHQTIHAGAEQHQEEGDPNQGEDDAKDLSAVTDGCDVTVTDGRNHGRREEKRLSKAPVQFIVAVLQG